MSHIENHSAYGAAIERNIKANARIGRSRRWRAETPDAQRITDWLQNTGEFAPSDPVYDDNGFFLRQTEHPASIERIKGSFRRVLADMHCSLMEWGGLTPAQTNMVRNAMNRSIELAATREQARAEQRANDVANSKHVGTVGERREFTLKVERVMEFEGQYGFTYINICRDADGNIVVYKGSNEFERGETIAVKATVKAHEMRDGVAQTIIARPKVS